MLEVVGFGQLILESPVCILEGGDLHLELAHAAFHLFLGNSPVDEGLVLAVDTIQVDLQLSVPALSRVDAPASIFFAVFHELLDGVHLPLIAVCFVLQRQSLLLKLVVLASK